VLATLRAIFPEIGSFTQRDRSAETLSPLFDGPPADATPVRLAPFATLSTAAAAPPVSLPDDAQPLDHAEINGLRIAGGLRNRVGKVPKTKVLAEISKIETKGQARAYMRDVDSMISAKTARSRIIRGRKARKITPKAQAARSPGKRPKTAKSTRGKRKSR
jgi:hypothetical protein